MQNQNIFYASNAQQDIFAQNTRSHFQNNIPKEHLDYISNDELEVGIKSITFDNNLRTAQIDHQETEPHIIIFQKKDKTIHMKDLFNFPNVQEKFHFLKKPNEKLSFDRNRDYVTTIKNLPLAANETFYFYQSSDGQPIFLH